MSTVMIIAYSVQWIVLVFLMVLLYRLLKLIGRYIQLAESGMAGTQNQNPMDIGPKLYSNAPLIETKYIGSNEMFSLTKWDESKSQKLLMFLAPGCSACEKLLEDFTTAEKFINTEIIGVISTKGNSKNFDLSTHPYVNQLQEKNIPVISSKAIDKGYNINTFPHGILIDRNLKVIGKSVLFNEDSIYKLVDKQSMKSA
ncbi:hypothetical protein V1502_18695 [Bacillus sp. SCS-153A]|uniref:hypothetical protein n=1 Tax=Rossellomorea sedimentorum TaxID=3115294 RepID=UPI0039066D1F